VFEPGSSFSSVINDRTVKDLAKRLKSSHPAFDEKSFVRQIDLEGLKITDRVKQVADALDQHLPKDFKQSATIIVESLPPEIPEAQAGKTLADHFIVMAMADFIARNGLERPLFSISMEALKAITKSFSSESAIRPFLEKFPEETLAYLQACTGDQNVHVRRWASEGSRPRLPWAKPLRAFIQDPRPLLPLLEALKDDPHLYVRRSVANSLNDISKDNPELLVRLLKKWRKDANKERLWIIRHSLRTLAKKAHPAALELLGYDVGNFEVKKFKWTKAVTLGSDLEFSFVLCNAGSSQSVLVDYVIEFKKKSGSAEKVFKLRKIQLDQGEDLLVTGKRRLDHFSTRTMYPGKHKLILQINGQRLAEGTFMVR